jgi:hypothetical protein
MCWLFEALVALASPNLTLKRSLGPLQIEDSGARREAALEEAIQARFLGLHGTHLVLVSLNIRVIAGVLFGQLIDPPVEDRGIADKGGATRLKFGVLTLYRLLNKRIGAVRQVLGEFDSVGLAQLGSEPRLGGARQCQLLEVDVVLGPGAGVVQKQQGLPGLHAIAVLDLDLLNDPALKVLHALAVTLDGDDAVGDDCAIERGDRRPKAKSTEKDQDDDPADARNASC